MTTQTAQNEHSAWEAMIEHTSPRVCHTCFMAYGSARSDAECMENMCVDGRALRQAWLDAFEVNGNRRG